MVGGLVMLGSDDQASCAMRADCGDPFGRVALGVGLFAGGAASAILGIGLTLGAAEQRPRVRQRDTMVATGAVLTGLCTAGQIGSAASGVLLLSRSLSTNRFESGGPPDAAPSLFASLLVSPLAFGVMCGIGAPLWIQGLGPNEEKVEERRRRTSRRERHRWTTRSPTMLAVGATMATIGIVGAASLGAWVATQAEGGGNISILRPGIFIPPGAALAVTGIILVGHGGREVPASWWVSLAPHVQLAPGGMGLDWRF